MLLVQDRDSSPFMLTYPPTPLHLDMQSDLEKSCFDPVQVATYGDNG